MYICDEYKRRDEKKACRSFSAPVENPVGIFYFISVRTGNILRLYSIPAVHYLADECLTVCLKRSFDRWQIFRSLPPFIFRNTMNCEMNKEGGDTAVRV